MSTRQRKSKKKKTQTVSDAGPNMYKSELNKMAYLMYLWYIDDWTDPIRREQPMIEELEDERLCYRCKSLIQAAKFGTNPQVLQGRIAQCSCFCGF